MRDPSRSPSLAAALVVFATAAVVALRLLLAPVLGAPAPLLLLTMAVMLSAWYGGFWPGVAATALNALLGCLLFLDPPFFQAVPTVTEVVHLCLFVIAGLLVSALSGATHRARRRAQASAAVARRRQAELLNQVTERQRAEELLSETNARLEDILETLSDPFCAFDRKWRYVFVNSRAAELAGRPREQLLGRPITACPPSASGFGFDASLVRAAESGQPAHFESFSSSVGRWFENHFYPSERGYTLYSSDVTERKHAEQALRESEAMFRTMADNAPVMIWMSGADGQCTYFNRPWFDFTGRTLEQEQGDGWMDGVHPADLDHFLETYRTGFDARRPIELEYRLRRRDGAYRWVFDKGTPRFGAEGEFEGYLGSCIDVTERRAAEEAQREANRRKDEFLATLAHELRNPLAPICSALRVIRQAPDSAAAAFQESRAILERQVGQLVRLIDDLLDISRIKRGKIELRRQRVELEAVVASALETSRPLLDAAGLELTVSLPPGPVALDGDATRLAQVLANLLNNAAKYTDAGGRVWLTAAVEWGQLALRVRDTGVGIAADTLPHVFEMFRQSHRVLARAQGGLGIGLSLVRGLVELHGGSVSANSDGPGRGSEFTLRLPLAESEPPPAAGAGTTAAVAPPTVIRRRVLVVDDNVDAARSLGTFLDLMGNEVRVFHDGRSALATAPAFRPDVVLLDLGMPEMDGYEVARRLRQQPEMKDAFLVALTGWGQEADRRNSRAAGFDYHLVKPADPDVIQSLVQGRQPSEAEASAVVGR